jgi:N,N'-diacetyllegionaminate synthase
LSKVKIIAEIAQAHDGSLGMLHSYIDAVKECGVDAVKFQTHIADAESSEFEPFRVKFSKQDATRFDYWKRMEFTAEQWKGIREHCDEAGLEFISSPFSMAAVDLLEKLDMPLYKIASGEVTNFLMLDRIARTGKPIYISSGMSSFEELENCINYLKPFGNPLTILQCTTSYPVPPEKIGLNVLSEIREKFGYPIGLSDHSGTIYPSLAAVVLGATVLEVHATFHKKMFGPDTKASLTLDELSDLVKGVRYLETAMANPVTKNNDEPYTELKKMFGKSLALNKAKKQGEVIAFEDLETKKPAGLGIHPQHFQRVVGKKLKKDLERNAFINNEDLE